MSSLSLVMSKQSPENVLRGQRRTGFRGDIFEASLGRLGVESSVLVAL